VTLCARFLTRNKRRTDPEIDLSDDQEDVERPPCISDEAYEMYVRQVLHQRKDPEGYARRAAAIRKAEEEGLFTEEFMLRIRDVLAKRKRSDRSG